MLSLTMCVDRSTNTKTDREKKKKNMACVMFHVTSVLASPMTGTGQGISGQTFCSKTLSFAEIWIHDRCRLYLSCVQISATDKQGLGANCQAQN